MLEDAAQSFGATYQGRRAGALAEAAATSFFPAKPLGGYGDGGAVFTDDDDLAAVLKSIRNHGQGTDRYDNVRLGINGRLDTLQAAVLLRQTGDLRPGIGGPPGSRPAVQRRPQRLGGACPHVAPGCSSVWAQYSVESEARAAILARLREAGVPTAIYYPKPLHLQEVFRAWATGRGISR